MGTSEGGGVCISLLGTEPTHLNQLAPLVNQLRQLPRTYIQFFLAVTPLSIAVTPLSLAVTPLSLEVTPLSLAVTHAPQYASPGHTFYPNELRTAAAKQTSRPFFASTTVVT